MSNNLKKIIAQDVQDHKPTSEQKKAAWEAICKKAGLEVPSQSQRETESENRS